MHSTQTVYLALGSNLGNRTDHIHQALDRLPQHVTILQVSPWYETEPWGIVDQPRFFNLVCSGATSLPPAPLLRFLKTIERRLGRQTGMRYGPRVIDLDILFYGHAIREDPHLTIPHPRLQERAFVLVPLADIAPDLVHPISHKTVTELLAAVQTGGVKRLATS